MRAPGSQVKASSCERTRPGEGARSREGRDVPEVRARGIRGRLRGGDVGEAARSRSEAQPWQPFQVLLLVFGLPLVFWLCI